MLEAIKVLIQSRDVCVLSTVSGGEPHCSLMSYVTDVTCREFYMITLTGTKKYRNLEGSSAVSLLIDTREEDVDHRRKGYPGPHRQRRISKNGRSLGAGEGPAATAGEASAPQGVC
jgi:uncharacterized protein YhbP (UPF0306 family)